MGAMNRRAEDEISSVAGLGQADPVGIEPPARAPSGMRS